MDSPRIAPADCANLDEIRAGMDSIDREIVALVTERVAYVRAAAPFKTSSPMSPLPSALPPYSKPGATRPRPPA